MRVSAQTLRRIARVKLPVALLITLLQRSPAVVFLENAGEFVFESPIGTVLKSIFAAAASLGAVESMAGATTLVATQNSPVSAKVGTPITPIGFTVTNTINIASWKIGGTLPPGLVLAATQGGASLTGPGLLDATSGSTSDGYGGVTMGNATTTPMLSGTPTAAGTFTFTLQAFESPGATDLASSVFNYTINVAAATAAPVFSAQPVSQTISSGSTVVFSAPASDATSYQWKLNGGNVAGATSSMLVLRGATAANAGTYTCVATNSIGSTTSSAATLAIGSASDFGRITNLSILTNLGAGEGLFTVGVAVGGAGTTGIKPLLLRAAGPALVPLGLTGVLPDPKMQLFSGGTATASNDNWGGDAQLSAAFAQVGAFGYPAATSKDAAIFMPTLASGQYTVQISDAGGGTGSVIAELYDATPSGAFTASTPRLINVSVLKQISAGSTLTAGFVVGGSTNKTVLVRAIGPTLSTFNVSGTMSDPKLTLFSGNTAIAANDNWGGDSQLSSVAASVGAFSINDSASKDAVLLITLPPGNYTAQAGGVGGVAGQALIEVYEVP